MTRAETDSCGPVDVPEDNYLVVETQRSHGHFKISGETFPLLFIRVPGEVKRSAVVANVRLDNMDPIPGDAAAAAALEVGDNRDAVRGARPL